MGIPLRQSLAVLGYILRQRLRGVERYPLVLMLEPLFRCNLACAGCGKIDYPEEILDRRLSPEECMAAIDECGAPIVSIAGGEPLIHKEMPEIVRGFVQRKKFVYLCTNALLLSRHMDDYTPSPYLTFSVHLDGGRDRHDTSVCRTGVFDQAVEAIHKAVQRRFRVTINCTLFQGESAEEVAEFLDDAMALGVEGVTISPGSAMNMRLAKMFSCSARRANNSSGIFSALVGSAGGGLTTPACFWIFLPVTRATVVHPGVTRRVTCWVGKGPVICLWTRGTRRRSKL